MPAPPPRPKLSPIAARVAAAAPEEHGLREIKRVCALPVDRLLTPAEVEEVSRVEVKPEWFTGATPEADGPFRLWRQQAQAIQAFDQHGLVLSSRVGSGKTIVYYLAIKHAHARRPSGEPPLAKRSLFIIPSDSVKKFHRDLEKMRKIIGFDVPVHVLAGESPRQRLEIARRGLFGCYVTTYSLFQRPQVLEEMDLIQPSLVCADEAHVLCNVNSNATQKKRIFWVLEKWRSKFLPGSGTLSNHSFMDLWPIFYYALRERAPVPLERQPAEFWATAIDLERPPSDVLETMIPLLDWLKDAVRRGLVDPAEVGGPASPDADGVRRAWRVRRNTAPGVVAAAEGEVGTRLVIENGPARVPGGPSEASEIDRLAERLVARLEDAFPPPLPDDFEPREVFRRPVPLGGLAASDAPGQALEGLRAPTLLSDWERMVALIWAVEQRWLSPNGDEIEYGFHKWQDQCELSAGFYNELEWPSPEDLAAKRGVSTAEAVDILARAKKHRKARSRYTRVVREFLSGPHVPELDQPLLVWNACLRRDRRLPEDVYEAWVKLQGATFEGCPERESSVGRVCPWKVDAAVEWARGIEAEHGRNAGGLVWCWNKEVASWAREKFTEAFGPDRVLWAPATQAADAAISDPASAKLWTIASIAGHHKAKDLPHYRHQCFIQWPRSAKVVEQALGRTLRPGQKADVLRVRTFDSLVIDRALRSASLYDAMWLSQAEARHIAVFCDYEPMPEVHPERWLRERGFRLEAKSSQERAMRLVFGGKNT